MQPFAECPLLNALVAELVDVVDLGSTALRCVGSSPTGGKYINNKVLLYVFICL